MYNPFMEHKFTPGVDYPAIACGVYIMNQEGKFLMLLRSDKARNDKRMWGIPGGLVEFGEKIEDAIVRETVEECGLKVSNLELVGYYTHLIPEMSAHFVTIQFKTMKYSGVPKIGEPEKFLDIGWFDKDDLPDNTSVVVREMIGKL